MKIKTIASSSKGCCYVVENRGKRIIIEAGITIKKIREALDYDLSNIEAVLISHVHGDHCKYLNSFYKYLPVPIYGGLELYSKFPYVGILRPLEKEVFNSFKLTPIKLYHDVECFGFVIKSDKNVLFYATDTNRLPYQIKGLTHLMIEANHSMETLIESERDKALINRICNTHLDIDQAIDFALRHINTLKEIHLIHLSDAHADADMFKTMMQRATGLPVYLAKE